MMKNEKTRKLIYISRVQTFVEGQLFEFYGHKISHIKLSRKGSKIAKPRKFLSGKTSSFEIVNFLSLIYGYFKTWHARVLFQ